MDPADEFDLVGVQQEGRHNPGSQHEQTPLLKHRPPVSDDGGDENEDDGDTLQDFTHLPWYRQPSIGWILVPYLVLALIYGGIISPKINLVVDLVCREYYSTHHLADPSSVRVTANAFDDGGRDLCRTPEVSQRVSLFMLLGDLLGAILPAVVSPRLGALSDLYGRKPILILNGLGSMGGEVITLLVASYRDTVNVNWMLLSFFLEGVTGSAILAMAMVNTYATDCVPAHRRSTAFGYFHGCTCIGIALGPILAGYVVEWSGSIVTVFWIMLGIHVCCAFFVVLFVPESVSTRRRKQAREKAARRDGASSMRHLNPLALLAPLKVLYPTGPGSSPALRRNLVVLAAMDTIMYGVAMGSANVLLIYVNYRFGWGTFESGRYLTAVNCTRVAFLMAILPIITRLIRGRGGDHPSASSQGSDWFDLTIMRIGIALETAGWVGYSMAGRGDLFTLSGIVGAAGSVSSPALQSALTQHVPADRTGQLLGANGLLHALAQIVAPVIFNAVFVATVGHFPQAAFVCLAATFGTAFVISWLIKPHVYHEVEEDVTAMPGFTNTTASTE
ncbi:major facilitator superfamily domain-containing protein [Aspergillus avenaceus]|uniref:Major facilitator superfamily domain-containing protein n=1 Tax=Aspergillus avenaceus TaxID=36643 RepID=A0A5N6U504_ASPAV|nr:major facilitator superfamily domain-containing protein [Aspergillus avenaceus]